MFSGLEEYAYLPEETLTTISENPPDGSVLDSLIDIWDGSSIQSLTSLIRDEVALRRRSNCTIRTHKRKAPVHDVRVGRVDVREGTDEEESDGEDGEGVSIVGAKQTPAQCLSGLGEIKEADVTKKAKSRASAHGSSGLRLRRQPPRTGILTVCSVVICVVRY